MSESDYPELNDSGEVTEPANPREKPMGFWDHLEELRWTVVKSAIVFAVFAAAIGIFLKEFNEVLLWPLNTVKAAFPTFVLDLGTTTIMEAFSVVIQMCCLGGLVLGAPFILFFVGQFVSPALKPEEIRMVIPVALSSFVLFIIGAVFSFFILVPGTIRVSLELNELFGFVARWTPGAYYSLLMWLVLGVGAAFEFPLLILLLVYLRIMTTRRLIGWWRHALVVVFVISAIVTPTPDPVTQTLLAVPLYLLYWIAIIVGMRVEKNRERKLKARG